MMHTYRDKSLLDATVKPGTKFAVGYFMRGPRVGDVETGDEWTTLREFTHATEAARFTNYLNGGPGTPLTGY